MSSAAFCTDSTKISLTSATSTVTTASVTRASPMGHAGSLGSACSALAKISRCVLSENSKPKPYPTISSTAKAMLSFWVSAVAGTKSALAIADGLTSAIVARNSKAASRRAVARLYSWTWCVRPPRRNDTPSMNSVLVTIAPAMEPFTSAYSPARSAAAAMTSSVRFPSVALSSPPTVSPVFSATDSVARLSKAAIGIWV